MGKQLDELIDCGGAVRDLTQKVSILKNKIPQNSNIRVFLKGDVFFLKKKAPARNAPVVVRAGFHQKSKIQGILTKIIPFSGKVQEAK